MKNAYELINHTLVKLINEIWELEEKAIITEEFKDLSNNDMHVIEACRAQEKRRRPQSRVCKADKEGGKSLPSSRGLSPADDPGDPG